jgi:hypothetical protein
MNVINVINVFNEIDETYEIDQTDEIDQIDEIDPLCRFSYMAWKATTRGQSRSFSGNIILI